MEVFAAPSVVVAIIKGYKPPARPSVRAYSRMADQKHCGRVNAIAKVRVARTTRTRTHLTTQEAIDYSISQVSC